MATSKPLITRLGPGEFQICVPEDFAGSIDDIDAAVLAMTMADLEQDLSNVNDSAHMKRERKARYRPFNKG